MNRIGPLVLTAVVALALPTSVGAQSKQEPPSTNLDVGLLRQAPKVVSFLCGKEYRSVGVLPFRVYKGEREAGHDDAPLAARMASRVENALIMVMDPDEKKALQVIHDAAAHASAKGVGAWSTDKGAFDKLFATTYPLAWGDSKVEPEVFLTGVVSNTGDRTTTTIEVVAFTRGDWKDGVKTTPVATFTVRTDRAMLRDLGHNYALSPDVAKRGKSARDRDRQALEQVVAQERGKADKAPRPDDCAGFRFDLWYGDEKQTPKPLAGKKDGAKAALYEVAPPEAEAKVKLGLTRLDGKAGRLGVILKLNGISTYQMDERDSLQCLKWLFDAKDKGEGFVFTGFVMDAKGDEIRPFRVLTKKESAKKAAELGGRAGWIDVDVFASGEEEQEEEQLLISTRGGHVGKKPATLAELRKSLLARNNAQVKESTVVQRAPGGLIVADVEPVKGIKLDEWKLPNPVRIGGMSIRYYDATAK